MTNTSPAMTIAEGEERVAKGGGMAAGGERGAAVGKPTYSP